MVSHRLVAPHAQGICRHHDLHLILQPGLFTLTVISCPDLVGASARVLEPVESAPRAIEITNASIEIQVEQWLQETCQPSKDLEHSRWELGLNQ